MNKKIKIKSNEKNYYIEIKYNFFRNKLINLIDNNNKIIIIIDRNVEYLLNNIKFKNNIFIIKIKGSEKIKNFNNYEILTKKILSFGVDRNSIVIAIGGGTIGDLSGFVASTILRGVKFILIPTTLLSQVDSSIGGKNGINTNLGKNLIGTFYQPDEVFIDPRILKSLPKKEMQSGYAEIVKHALINDIFFFNWLDKNYKRIFKFEQNALVYAIHKSIKIKAKFIETDTKEILINNKSRALLNFGHTFGHALETLDEYKNKITHGEAISRVPSRTPGTYLLSRRQVGTFNYVGRSDRDLQSRIRDHIGSGYTRYWFAGTTTALEAYVFECRYFQMRGGSLRLDNLINPAIPVDSWATCPVCRLYIGNKSCAAAVRAAVKL